jgi:hypothetical protein
MTPAQYAQFLASLKTDLTRWQAPLAEVDIGTLGLDLKSGNAVENMLSSAKRTVGQCQESEAELEKRQTLGDSVRLYSWMESLEQQFGELSDAVIGMSGNSSQASMLMGKLGVSQKEIGEDTVKLLGHVLAIADIADDSCPQLRHYLR